MLFVRWACFYCLIDWQCGEDDGIRCMASEYQHYNTTVPPSHITTRSPPHPQMTPPTSSSSWSWSHILVEVEVLGYAQRGVAVVVDRLYVAVAVLKRRRRGWLPHTAHGKKKEKKKKTKRGSKRCFSLNMKDNLKACMHPKHDVWIRLTT